MEKPGLINPDTTLSIKTPETLIPERIDKYLPLRLPLYSRNFFQRLIKEGLISLNEQTIDKSSTLVQPHDTISIQFPSERSIAPEDIASQNLPITVVHENTDFFIVNKPAGLLTHPTSSRDPNITLADWLVVTFKEVSSVGHIDRPGIVHRLDKDTSGLLIIPRTNDIHNIFGDMFRERSIHKTYLAVVQGHPERSGIIDLPTGRHQAQKHKMTTYDKESQPICTKTREAITHYKVLEYFDECSLMEVKPVTGRTHQIRVHFAAIGHPLVGDQLYGKKSKLIKRQALHAYSLSFVFKNQHYTFKQDVPGDFNKLTNQLR